MPSPHVVRSARAGLFSVIALVGASLLPTTALAGGAATDCVVTNVTQHTYRSTLLAGVKSATAGDVLWVSGTCVGSSVIDRNLVIRGFRTSTSGRPILDGGNVGRVLTVDNGVVVKIQGLIIRHGHAGGEFGGGILNAGTLRLTNVIVVTNQADSGGGIYSTGRLSLNGTTIVRANVADTDDGGGVYVAGGSATMNDTSRVHANSSSRGGGGVYVVDGRFSMKDQSSVDHNLAVEGGGVYSDFSSSVTLVDSSSVDHNTASQRGGGIVDNARVTLKGSSTVRDNNAAVGGGVFRSCNTFLVGAGHARVYQNHPDNNANESGCS